MVIFFVETSWFIDQYLHNPQQEVLMTKPPPLCLRPDVTFDIFRHGHSAPADDDFSRRLSATGKVQAQVLGRKLSSPYYDIGICSSAPLTLETAVFASGAVVPYWFIGGGRQFYSPAFDEDHAELMRLWASLRSSSYRVYLDSDARGIFQRFKSETLAIMAGWRDADRQPFVPRAKNILMFNHAVMSNAIAEALFPQHAEKVRGIELAPCDGIRLTATSCEHLRLA